MTFAHVGTTQSWDTGATHSYTPGGVGRLVVFCYITKLASTPMPTGLSASNITWSRLTSDFATSVAATPTGASIWIGVTTSTSPANTTITWSGSEPAHWEAEVNEFTSTVGSWALDTSAGIDSNSNNAYPSLTPAGSGELYIGIHYDDSGASAGSTSGYTYQVTSHGNGALYNAACTSSAQAPTWADSTVMGGIAALIKEASSSDTGTVAVTLKKMTTSGSDKPYFNTGTTVTATNVPQSTHPTLVIPASVRENDCMIIGVDLFGFTGDTGVAINLTPGVSGNNWTQIGGLQSYDDGSIKVYGAVFVRQATADDAGSTLTFSYSGTPTTDQKWWAISLASYTGLDASKIDVFASSGAISGTTWPTPSGATTRDGAWGIYVTPSGVNGSGFITAAPAGTTLRENANTAGVACGIADTNGSVGGVGTSIGGGNWTGSSSGGWKTAFSLAVGPKAPTTVQTLFDQADLGISIGGSDVTEYTLGMEFSLSADSPLSEIWFYSPATATALPIGAAIWDINANSIVSGTQNDSPSWSGAAASGWVKVPYDRSVTLKAGTKYSVAVKKDTTALVYGLTPHYWDTTGTGASGQTNGIISAPNDVSAVHGQDAFTTGASWSLPNGSFNAANYGIDVGVVVPMPPSSSVTGTADIALKKMTVAVTGAVFDKGTSTATLKKMTVSGTATAPVAGTAAPKFRKMTTFGSGKAKVSGTISVTLRKMTDSGTGLAPIFGTISVTMLKMEVRASDHVPEASPLFLFSQF